MSEFKLERFKYNWIGEWQAAYSYNRDDVVIVGPSAYVCIEQHTSDADFNVDLDFVVPNSNPPLAKPKWVLMQRGQTYAGRWQSSYQYQSGDIVLFTGSLYLCVDGHLSTTFEEYSSKFILFASAMEFIGNWETGTEYGAGAIVKYNGINFKCIALHTSQDILEDNITDWEIFNETNQFVGTYQQNYLYKKNDYVNFGGSIYVVTNTHTSTGNFAATNFDLVAVGYVYAGAFDEAVDYGAGDIVQFGGIFYTCLNATKGIPPTNDSTQEFWSKLVESFSFRGDFTENADYLPGDVLRIGGELFSVNTEISDATFDDLNQNDNFTLILSGQKWANYWKLGIRYETSELVYFKGAVYEAIQSHLSNAENVPWDNALFWQKTTQQGNQGGMQNYGDLLTYDYQRSYDGDLSTIGPTDISIGELDNLLSIDENSKVLWRKIHQTEVTVVYVSTTGSNLVGNGLDPYHPFRTIRYACQFVEKNELFPCKISVATGMYEEILPIVIPKLTVVMGDELRSTTISAKRSVVGYDEYPSYFFAFLSHFQNIFNNLILQNIITPQEGNTVEQISNLPELEIAGPIVTIINNLFTDIRNDVDYVLDKIGNKVTVTGSNNISTNLDRTLAGNIIDANLIFLQEEAIAYLQNNFTIDNLDTEKIRNDVEQVLFGIVYDLKYPGNYMSLRSAKYFVNSIVGSTSDDMFYVRDATGLRQCTVQGLDGTVDKNATIATVRPTGGAFISLDPGWGPDDEKTWIATRSPYVQGVTTIGTACTGAKIDGILHNGGNRSMVANDFTQVISDGIGAWVRNKGRTELVSVFTYYAYAGYLAESGGTIRATNGNNSYGTYGSVALGIDPTETPTNASVDNRNQQATISRAFAGEIADDSGEVDRILVFEYSNAGINYTTANTTVIGSGNFVDPRFEDFRTQGVFELRLIEPEDSSNIGGVGYTNRGNNAQGGDDVSITLASNDLFTPEQYIGQRLVIASGTGTGQYGYIFAYDDILKIASIYKESTDQPGWDHVVPGTHIEPTLESNTFYVIEPRISVDPPTQNFDIKNQSNFSLWNDVEFGSVIETYNGINIDNGTGNTIDLAPIPAVINVTKSGTDYSVTFISRGAGYAVGEEFTISGEILGGNTPENDLTIEVLTNSDDSTNSIQTVRITGEAFSFAWVGIAQGTRASFSSDGITWTGASMPSNRLWKKVVSGNNRFVAIPVDNVDRVAYSTTGKTWIERSLPSQSRLTDIVFANGLFVISTTLSNKVFYSSDGSTWNETAIPTSTTLTWSAISYGYGKFMIISDGANRTITTSIDGINWATPTNDVLPADAFNYVSMVHNGGMFIALTDTNKIIYSIENTLNNWQVLELPSADSGVTTWTRITYGNGLFFITAQDVDTQYILQSQDGINWTEVNTGSSRFWAVVKFGKKSANVGQFLIQAHNISGGIGTDDVINYQTGAVPVVRAKLDGSAIGEFTIINPGSGYQSAPGVTITDNQVQVDAFAQVRIGNGVLAQPTFYNRGIGYRTSTTQVTLTGDGFADVIPSRTHFITVTGLNNYPGPGAQLRISGIVDIVDEVEEIRILTLVSITPLGDDGSNNGTLRAEFRISPQIENKDDLQHGTSIEIRERYSQCRITGHDFLDIGTGNFIETNYPLLYSAGEVFTTASENEVIEDDGGRVFYVSTDQDGNFRTGELFAVEQATGIVTISADFFNLDGLSELQLGGVRLGGSGTVIREFSTDVLFSADSNNIVPTQRAIVTFLESRISAGGSELQTNNLVAGLISVGTPENIITHTGGTNKTIDFPKRVEFEGDNNTGTSGMVLAQNMVLRTVTQDDYII